MGGIGLLFAERDGVQRPIVHPQFLQRPDLLQRLVHRARRMALGRRLEPLQMAGRRAVLGCVGPVDGFEQYGLAKPGLDGGGHRRLGGVKGLTRPICHAARTRDDDASFVQPQADGFGEIVGVGGLERGDGENFLELFGVTLIEFLQAEIGACPGLVLI